MANDGTHERLAKLEKRMLGAEAGGGGGTFVLTAADLAPFSGVVFSPPLPGGPFEPAANKSNASVAADSATLFPTQHGAKIYADTKLALTGGVLSGDLDISTGIHLDTDGSASFGVGNALFSTSGDLSFSGTLHAGLRLNNLTTAERDAIAAPTAGMLIWNTTTAAVERYSGAAWAAVGGAGSSPPFSDGTALVMGSGDPTKLLRFEVDGFTAATTRVLTPQNANYIIAGTNFANTFSVVQTFNDDIEVGGFVHLESSAGDSTFGAGALHITPTGDLSWASTTIAGLRVNNLTSGQLGAISPAAAAGDIIFNTTDTQFQFYNGSVWSGFLPTTGGTLTGDLIFSGGSLRLGATAGTIAADQNDYAIGTASYRRIDATGADRTITGMAGGASGRLFTVSNVGATFNILFANQSGSSAAANRITTGTGATVTLAPGQTIDFIYNSTQAVWQALGLGYSTGGSSPPFLDTNALVMGSADATKLLRFEVDGFTTGTTRVLTPQNASYTLAGLETAQTFVAKQTITPPADTTALQVTGFSLTGATTAPMLDLAGTWNTSGVTTALLLNITNTASGADSKLLDLQLGGTSFLSLSKTAVLRLGDGTAPAGDPTAAIQQWSAGGEWQYRAATASEGAGQTNRVHNRAQQVAATGTTYSLTTTLSRVDFGTQDPEVTLPSAGTYLIIAGVQFFSDFLTSGDNFYAQLFNATDSALIGGAATVILAADFRGWVTLTAVVTVPSSKLIQIYAANANGARGEVELNTIISYVRLS